MNQHPTDRRQRHEPKGTAALEVVMTTAVGVPLAGLMFFLGIQICRYVYAALSGLLLQPFL